MKERVFAVFGLGAFGSEICRSLSERGARVIAIDKQPKLIERIKDDVTQALLFDSTEEEALAGAPLDDIDVAVVAMGDDIEASILTTAMLKSMGIPFIMARAVSDIHHKVLKQVGADDVVNLEIEEGRIIATRLLTQDALERISISADYSIAEVYAPAEAIGKTVEDMGEKTGVNVMAVKRITTNIDNLGNPVRDEAVRLPSGRDIVRENDIYLIVGKNRDVEKIKEGRKGGT
jgi:trk system potassium uptake protein TrkA